MVFLRVLRFPPPIKLTATIFNNLFISFSETEVFFNFVLVLFLKKYYFFYFSSAKKRSFINGFVCGFSNCIVFFAYAAAFTYGSYLVQEGELEFHYVFRYAIDEIL